MENFFIRNFCEVFGDSHIEKITKRQILNWLTEKKNSGLKNSSLNRYVNILRPIFKYAVECNFLHESPVKNLKRFKEGEPRYRNIAKQEIHDVVLHLEYMSDKEPKTPKQSIAWAFLFALETAMRQGEIYTLQWHDIFIEKRYCILRDTKNGKVYLCQGEL